MTDADKDGFYSNVDCNDLDATVYPGATEVPYDGIDQNCDGKDLVDVDGDGWSATAAGGEDCDDTNSGVHPGASDSWYDGVDANCDGADDYDQDGDGHDSADFGGDDCIDTDPTVHPGATEIWYDGIDQNCDGNDQDQDGDGVDVQDDCDDTDPTITTCDSGGTADSGVHTDGGSDGGTRNGGDGGVPRLTTCGCASQPPPGAALGSAWLLLVFGAVRRRRPADQPPDGPQLDP